MLAAPLPGHPGKRSKVFADASDFLARDRHRFSCVIDFQRSQFVAGQVNSSGRSHEKVRARIDIHVGPWTRGGSRSALHCDINLCRAGFADFSQQSPVDWASLGQSFRRSDICAIDEVRNGFHGMSNCRHYTSRLEQKP